jgi:hypothetical protein
LTGDFPSITSLNLFLSSNACTQKTCYDLNLFPNIKTLGLYRDDIYNGTISSYFDSKFVESLFLYDISFLSVCKDKFPNAKLVQIGHSGSESFFPSVLKADDLSFLTDTFLNLKQLILGEKDSQFLGKYFPDAYDLPASHLGVLLVKGLSITILTREILGNCLANFIHSMFLESRATTTYTMYVEVFRKYFTLKFNMLNLKPSRVDALLSPQQIVDWINTRAPKGTETRKTLKFSCCVRDLPSASYTPYDLVTIVYK